MKSARLPRRLLAATFVIVAAEFGGDLYAQAPVAGVAYQVPSAHANVPPGTLIQYGGYSYVAQGNGTMLLTAQQAAAPPPVATYAPGVTYTNPAYAPYANYYGPVRPGWRPNPYRPYGGFGPTPLTPSPWNNWGPWPRGRRGGVFVWP